MAASASRAVVTPEKVIPSGLSSDLAAAFNPLTNSLSTSGSSLMMRTRLTGFFIGRASGKADYTFRPSPGPMSPRSDEFVVKCVVVDVRLKDIEPMAYNFLMNFARDNELQVREG